MLCPSLSCPCSGIMLCPSLRCPCSGIMLCPSLSCPCSGIILCSSLSCPCSEIILCPSLSCRCSGPILCPGVTAPSLPPSPSPPCPRGGVACGKEGVVTAKGRGLQPTPAFRVGTGREEPNRTGPGAAEGARAEPNRAGSSRSRSGRAERSREQPKALGPAGCAAGHGADRVGHVGERAGARRRAHPADGRHRGRGGAVQGLVLRGVFHRGRRPGVPARVPQEQAAKGLHHGEVWPEVPDSRGEAVRAPHQELLHPSRPARRPGCPCRFPPLHHPGHRLPGHRQRHLPAGCGSRGGVETHRAEAPGATPRRGHLQAAPQQPPAPAAPRRPQEAAGGGGAGEPHPCGGGITGDPAALLPCSCFPAAPGSTAGNGGLLGIPKTPRVLSSLLWVLLRSLGSSVPPGLPKGFPDPQCCCGVPQLLGISSSSAMLSSL